MHSGPGAQSWLSRRARSRHERGNEAAYSLRKMEIRGRKRPMIDQLPSGSTGLSISEQESHSQLRLARIADARNEPGRLAERRAARVAVITAHEVRGVEHIEELGKETHPAVSRAQRHELRRAQVEDVGRVAASGVERHLLAGRRIDVAIVVVAVGIEVAAGRQVERTGTRRLEDR